MFSMKASNPVIMVQAYRLLVAEMYNLGWDYPLHLGVTEAGEGEDGRMKSAIGIGTLLMVIAFLLCVLYCIYHIFPSAKGKHALCLPFVVLQDGLGDTIRVSLTEPPEEEIDPCRRLANLGTHAADLQIGVVTIYYFSLVLHFSLV